MCGCQPVFNLCSALSKGDRGTVGRKGLKGQKGEQGPPGLDQPCPVVSSFANLPPTLLLSPPLMSYLTHVWMNE